jgi:MoaA/NifB/PqqE/SkfB family radical SAM enzyme
MRLPQHIPPPRFLYLELNLRCNLKCEHCHFWKRTDDFSKYPSFEWREQLLKTFAEMNPQGTLVTCGGEQMLDADNYFHATRTAAQLGLRCFSVVNGTRVTQHNAYRMMDEGPSEITVSIDSHTPELHDAIRGVKGSWKVAVNAVRRMLDARDATGADKKIYAMAVVSERNYRTLPQFFDWALTWLGVDKLKLNIVQPSFGIESGGADFYYNAETIKDPASLTALLRECDETYYLNINPEWLRQVEMYFNSIKAHGEGMMGWSARKGTTEHICNTYDRNMMVDLEKNVRLCFSHAFPAGKLDDPTTLKQFWYQDSERWRPKMRQCNRYCGISHSVRKLPCTIQEAGSSVTSLLNT